MISHSAEKRACHSQSLLSSHIGRTKLELIPRIVSKLKTLGYEEAEMAAVNWGRGLKSFIGVVKGEPLTEKGEATLRRALLVIERPPIRLADDDVIYLRGSR